ncbi:MAG: amidohydrolase [Candidatus Hydrogenedentes bacterium]|nr:amidohydrolase [Candidatus Hydrogenedentota bacterium]
MWVPKWYRDRKKGIESPIPTQVVSNEEFIPRPQTREQAQVEWLIGKLAEEKSRKLGMERRAFLASSMGIATAFMASNMVYGNYWNVAEAETLEPGAYEDKFPKGEYFIFDVQTHFTNGFNLGFRSAPFIRSMGFKLSEDAEAYSFENFVKEMFFDSETSLICISGVPGKEINRGADGAILEGKDRSPGMLGLLPSWLMSERKYELNEIAGSQRALCQGNCAPNHYWDKAANKPAFNELFEQMEREVKQYKIDSWKWYCHMDPAKSGNGFRLDDEAMTYPFYEKSKELGLKTFSIHKGYASQSRMLGHFAHPGDVEKAALAHPDISFIVYHSAMKHGPGEPEFDKDGTFNPETGDFEWHRELMAIKKRNPGMNNVYCEIGSAFGTLAIVHPQLAQHLIGQNIKHYGVDHVIWGTDCLWWGSPQWVIDAFKRLEISDELCEKYGYSKLTKEDKAKIFGLNAARIYGIDVNAARTNFPKDTLSRLKTAYVEQGILRDNAAHGWVRAESA